MNMRSNRYELLHNYLLEFLFRQVYLTPFHFYYICNGAIYYIDVDYIEITTKWRFRRLTCSYHL